MDRVLGALAARGIATHKGGQGWLSHCPAHEDKTPSLSISEGHDGRALLKCFAGCTAESIVAALGLAMTDLFSDPPKAARFTGQGSTAQAEPKHSPTAQTFAEFCATRKLDLARLASRWQVKETNIHGRACLQYPTALKVDRLKFLDGQKPKYLWAQAGKGKSHWYGMGAARKHGGPVLYIVNGEPSVWACDLEGVSAVCLCGEGVTPGASLIQELKTSGFERFAIVYDLDDAGRKGARATVEALRKAELDARALELPASLGPHGDVDDLHRREGAGLKAALEALPELPEGAPLGILLKDVKPRKVQWLWRGWFPYGKVTMLDGDPGLGKTTLALDLAARLSRGYALPDGSPCEAGGAVIMTAEDDAGDTIRPRLEAAGAKLEKILYLDGLGEGGEIPVSIPENLPEVASAMARVNARLLIVDPIMAFFSGRVDSHKDQDVRRAMAPLKKLAGRTGAAIVCIRHLNKAPGGKGIYRGGGSIGIGGAARSVVLVHEDPGNPDLRVMASVKSNLSRPPQSLSFGLESVELPESGETSKVTWHGTSDLTAEGLLASPTDPEERGSQEQAEDFLHEMLSNGPVPVKRVWAAAEEAGISRYALKAAKARLKVVARHEGRPPRPGGHPGEPGQWLWGLPTEEAEKTPKESEKENFDPFEGTTAPKAFDDGHSPEGVEKPNLRPLRDNFDPFGGDGAMDPRELEKLEHEHPEFFTEA